MISQRIQNVTPSATSMLGGKISEMKAAGLDIASFNLGEPDFQTPQKIMDACSKAMLDGKTKYIAVGGILPLRRAICEKLEKDNHVAYDPSEVCVCTGAKQALYNAIMTICNPGDEIIIPTPCWVSYVEMVKLAGGKPVFVKTMPDFQLDVNAIEQAVTAHTKAVIINTPNNPTGAVYSLDALLHLAQLAVRHDFYVVSDEVYEKLIYDGAEHISIASLSPEMRERTITINGFSKAYSMTGWRLGYVAAPAEITKGLVSLQSHTTTNSTTFVQYAGIAALQDCAQDVETMRQEFAKRRAYMLERMEKLPDVTCTKPGGAFYLMPDVSSYYRKETADGQQIRDSFDFCNYVLREAHVAIVPGAAFEMPKCVRFAYSVSVETIQKGMDRLEAALAKLH